MSGYFGLVVEMNEGLMIRYNGKLLSIQIGSPGPKRIYNG